MRRTRGLFALLLAAMVVLVGGTTASAHDRLVSSDPANGATLVAVPAAVTLTFSDDVIADGTFVKVTADGADLGELAVMVDGAVVTAALPADLANGSYEVTWQVTSADGHPVADVLTFTLAVPEPSPTATEPEPAASPSATDETSEPAAAPSDEATDEATASAVPVTAELGGDEAEEQGSGTTGLWLVVGALVLAGLAVLIVRRAGGGGFDPRNGPPGQH